MEGTMQKAMSIGGKSRIDKSKDIIWIFNILASITGYKFLFGKKKGQYKRKIFGNIFPFNPFISKSLPNSPRKSISGLPSQKPFLVETAAASLLQQLSYPFLDKTLRCHRWLNYGGTSQICTCPFYSQTTMMANLSDCVSCCFRIIVLKLQALGSYF